MLGAPGWTRYEAEGFGTLWLAWAEDGLAILNLDGQPASAEAIARWLPEVELEERALPALVEETLDAYFAGEPVDPATLPVRIGGTKFQRRAWTTLREVPRGRVRTYAGLAKDIKRPRSMRAVGMAMGANPLPIVVPCHRVVAAGHELGGYSGGTERKRVLLELEGVKIQDGRVLPGQLDLPVPEGS